ncbi:MAG: endolytic transglycosylase MltG [Deltaproteobacteria bacterium]|nr:endolytic transglycosylase MltG [Deltaproteobacteria bacterium]
MHTTPPTADSPTTTRQRASTFTRVLLISFIVSVSFAVLAFLGFYYARYWIIDWSGRPRQIAEPVQVELLKGATLSSLSTQLEEKNLVADRRLFQWWVKYFYGYDHFQAGPYRFEGSVSPRLIADTMMRGEIYQPVVYQITVPEGATLRQIAERMSEGGLGSREEILAKAQDKELLQRLKVPANSLEGYLYPATYPFAVKPSATEVFTMMVQQFWKALPTDYEARVAQLGLTLTDAVTFASLIELETASDDERPLVSEVIWNRYKAKTALGIDAALIYGIKDYQGDITWKHLQDASNPYNLRLHAGLPPTPIASPSLKSLLAVLTPSNFGYLYYVVDAQDPSHHRFTKSFAEHNRNVREYLKSSQQRKSLPQTPVGATP